MASKITHGARGILYVGNQKVGVFNSVSYSTGSPKGNRMKIYLVKGSTGAYDDFHEWNVCAFDSAEQAEAFALQLNTYCKEIGVHRDSEDVNERYFDVHCLRDLDVDSMTREEWVQRQKERALTCPLDPNFHWDYNGVLYEIEELELRTGCIEGEVT